MALYKLFSYSVEVQYKSRLLSKATLFTVITTILTIVLPFVVAYRSRGFWLKTSYFYEQPLIHSTYDYLLIAETDDPSVNIICGDAAFLDDDRLVDEENCVEIQIQEDDINLDGKNDILKFKFDLIVPKGRIISSIILILGIDFQIRNVCPLQMQSLAVLTKEFSGQPSGFKYYGDLQIYQTSHLACLRNILDTSHNTSLFNHETYNTKNIVDFILDEYLIREVTTVVNPIYARTQNGQTGTMDLSINLRIAEMKFRYTPSLIQELKWAWPQYLSLLLIFYWLFERIRKFVFSNRLLMAWEIIPWRKKD
ncbi:transmembrane protein 231 [Maniola jurtina]|uniref:transmembrane protein 231 n=1 Tax=Maniola jurtina TaxID=191418 RepID=UPI001E689064|nr:transmembrane protein 231 [Maniola jurtina]XP_045762371.1 transmembrane protein 231 [Maniola jurtina]